jgi:hypothetical protein
MIRSGSSSTRTSRLKATPHVHLRNTWDSGKAIPDLDLDEFGQLHRVEGAGNPQQHHRKAGDVEFRTRGANDIIGQLVDLVFKPALNIDRRRVDVRTPDEADPTVLRPSEDEEVISSTPGTVATISSTICVTSRSITSGLAPSYSVRIR